MKPRRRIASTTPSRPPASSPSERDKEEIDTPNSSGPERIPPQWAWHYRTLLGLRERLLRVHAKHIAQTITPAEMLGSDVTESSQEHEDRDALWTLLGNETDQLFEVDCALQRIRDGTYGLCEKTGHVIPAERLHAVPWTRYSLEAAQAIELRTSKSKKPPR